MVTSLASFSLCSYSLSTASLPPDLPTSFSLILSLSFLALLQQQQDQRDDSEPSPISTGSKFRRNDLLASQANHLQQHEAENNEIIHKIHQLHQSQAGGSLSSSLPSSSSSSSSPPLSLLFDPPILEYGSTPVCIPSISMFTLINPLDTEFDLVSIQSDNPQFYPVLFQPQIIASQDSIQIQILYLPYSPQASQATLTLTTSLGLFQYFINTAPAYNSYHLHPFLGYRLATSVTSQHIISIYNPHDQPLHIREIYTTEEFLSLENLVPTSIQVDENNNPLDTSQWILESGVERNIISLLMSSSHAGSYSGYVHIKTNYDNIVIPVELNVVESGGLYVTPSLINFGILTNIHDVTTVNISLFNSGYQPIEIIEIFLSNPDSNLQINTLDSLSEDTMNTSGKILKSQTEKIIAKLVYTASVASGKVSNRIIIITNHSNPALAILEIPYEVSCVHGGIGYEFNQALFILPIRNISNKHLIIPSSGNPAIASESPSSLISPTVTDLLASLTNETSASYTELRNLTLTNYFSLTLHILHIQSVSCPDIVTVYPFSSPTQTPLIAPSLQSYEPVTIHFNKLIAQEMFRTKDSLPHQCWLDIHTNFSTVRLPLVVIDGNIDMKPIGEIVVSVLPLSPSLCLSLSLSLSFSVSLFLCLSISRLFLIFSGLFVSPTSPCVAPN
jgi:hypothetical protein